MSENPRSFHTGITPAELSDFELLAAMASVPMLPIHEREACAEALVDRVYELFRSEEWGIDFLRLVKGSPYEPYMPYLTLIFIELIGETTNEEERAIRRTNSNNAISLVSALQVQVREWLGPCAPRADGDRRGGC